MLQRLAFASLGEVRRTVLRRWDASCPSCRERHMGRSLQTFPTRSANTAAIYFYPNALPPSEAKAGNLEALLQNPRRVLFRAGSKSPKLHRKGQPIVARNNFVPPNRLPFAVKFLEFLEIGLPAIQFSLHPKEGSGRGSGRRPEVFLFYSPGKIAKSETVCSAERIRLG